MTSWENGVRVVVLLLAMSAGLLFILGTIRSTNWRGQSIFVASWGFVLFCSLILVANV